MGSKEARRLLEWAFRTAEGRVVAGSLILSQRPFNRATARQCLSGRVCAYTNCLFR
jgi:hypothetical protein